MDLDRVKRVKKKSLDWIGFHQESPAKVYQFSGIKSFFLTTSIVHFLYIRIYLRILLC